MIHRHAAPSGWFLVLLVVLGLLYVAWRSGRLRNIRWPFAGGAAREWWWTGVRLRPAAFVPSILLLIALAVLALTR